MPYYKRPSRFSKHWKKYAAARKIQRKWRKRRRAPVHNQRYSHVSNQLVSRTTQGKRNTKSLRSRVSALEVGAKKSHTFKIFEKQEILSYGIAGAADGQLGLNAAFQGWLRIPTKSMVGEIQQPAGDTTIESQVRDGHEVFVRSAKIKFEIETIRPSPTLTDASAVSLVGMLKQSDFNVRCCFTILRDTMASQESDQSTSVPRGHEITPGLRPLESLYTKAQPGYDVNSNNTMISEDYSLGMAGDTNFGCSNSFKSYSGSNRYKCVHQQVITLNSLNPRRSIEHTLVINSKLRYMLGAQDPADNPTAPSDPLNKNYLLFLSTTFSTNPLSSTNNNSIPNPALRMLMRPSVSKLAIRTYFTDS